MDIILYVIFQMTVVGLMLTTALGGLD